MEQRYQTHIGNLVQPLVHIISQQHIDVKLRHDGSDWFVVMNTDGSPVVKLPVAAGLDYYGGEDLGSSAIAITEYTNTDSRSSPIYLTWMRSDGSLVRTLDRDFQNTQITWLNDHVLLYQDDQSGRTAIHHGGLIDAETGKELMSITASYLLQANVKGEQVTLLWGDDAGVFWFVNIWSMGHAFITCALTRVCPRSICHQMAHNLSCKPPNTIISTILAQQALHWSR